MFKGYRIAAIDGSELSLPYNPNEENVIGENHHSTLYLNSLYDVCGKIFMDSVIQHGKERNETDAACIMVDRISEKYPVIIMADRGYENYNLFAHIEERLFDYVIFCKKEKFRRMIHFYISSSELWVCSNVILMTLTTTIFLSVPCYNGTMLKQDYYNDFFDFGQQKINFSFFELSLPDDDPVYTLKNVMEELDFSGLLFR